MKYIVTELHRNISDEALLADVKCVVKQLNVDTISAENYSKYGKYNSCTLIRRFGSWYTVLNKCGLSAARSPLNISNDELFSNLEFLWSYFGRQPKYHEIKKPLSKYSVGTYERRFGTYYNALRAFVNDVDGEIVNSKVSIKKQELTNPRTINYRLRFKILQRDNFKCKICGASPATDPNVTLHIDHIIPCAKGGMATYDNLQTLCSRCNLGKSDLNMY